MLLKSTFKLGGIHPPENKKYSEGKTIREIDPSETVFINLNQHLGKKARAVVEKGDEVSAGQIIAEADGFLSAVIHSPVSGKVKKIEQRLTAQGMTEETISIDTDAEKTAEALKQFETKKEVDIDKADPKELLESIRLAGIVGQGGATFPMHIKLSPPSEKKVDTLILNGAECEPYLTADHQLMLEQTGEIMEGARILKKILGVDKVIIGIEENKPDAIQKFLEYTGKPEYAGFTVAELKTKYPQGGEKQLIWAVTNREIPSGKLPFDVGVIVQNVGTTFAVYEAVYYGKPFIDRITTITGFVKNPGNFRVKIGTTFEHAIQNGAGGVTDEDHLRSVIHGGPMMGKSVRQLDVCVMKGTSGIVALSDAEFSFHEEGPCIRCGRCIDICPMGLMPATLADDTIVKNGSNLPDAMDCIECGSCSYVCPTSRKLVHWIRLGKTVYREWVAEQKKLEENQ